MIGIIGAMAVEVASLCNKMDVRETVTVSGIDFTVGTLGGKEVVVAKCGVGKVYAALCAQTMILKFAPDAVLNTGVGGGLNPSLRIGDLLVADRTVQHDMDTSALGDPVGMVSGINQIYFPCDERIVAQIKRCAEELGVRCAVGTVASGDQFVCDAAQKERITALFQADVCEMEGAAIGHVCTVNGTPYAVIRAVSDQANGEAPTDFPTFAANAAETAAAVAERFVTEY